MAQTAIKTGWVETTLGDVSSAISYGYTESASQEKIGPKFLRITDIQEDFINWANVPYCPISEKDYQKYKLEIGDIVIARTGNSTGATATIKQYLDAVFASYLIRFKIDPNKADYKFIDFLLRSETWKTFVKSIKSGSAQGGANAKSFAQFPILLPSLLEQRTIAAILSSLDDKIELLRTQNQTLESLAQKLFHEWFVEFNFPNAEGKPYKKNGGKMIDGELGEMPGGWKIGKLSDFVNHIKESTVPSINPDKTFSHYSIPAFDNGQKTEKQKGAEILSNKYIVKDFCFLVSKLNPSTPRIWTIFQAEENSVCSTEFQVFRTKNMESFPFVNSFLNTQEFSKLLASKAHGTSGSHQRVRPEDMLEAKIVTPNHELIIDFQRKILAFLQKVNQNKLSIQTLSIFRNTLLPRLMRGVLRMKFV